MKLSVGYQFPDEDQPPFSAIVREFIGAVGEVYFAWPGAPSGRSPVTVPDGLDREAFLRRFLDDLRAIRGLGARLHLLLNASCYGDAALSRTLAAEARGILLRLSAETALDGVTTMSPMIARLAREEFPGLDVRASVNLRLGAVRAFEYVADLFDSFNLQREFNRDLGRVQELRTWCDREGKRLHLLANSGCLNFCSFQTFHDNLVAHEADVDPGDLVDDVPETLCRRHYRDRRRRVTFLRNSWVRPEDLGRYEGRVSTVKLATRMHPDPRRVVRAYAEGRFSGNLLELLEPGHAALFAPFVVDNARFPADWFDRTTRCDKRCHACDYCAQVLDQVLVDTRQGAPTAPRA